MKAFFSNDAKEKVKQAIIEAERATSAEVVVTVKPRVSRYRDVDFAVGAVFALIALCVLMFHPAELDENWFPVAVAAAFALGATLTAAVSPLKRALIPKRRRHDELQRAARDAFVTLGVHGTKGRTGLLVYVAAFEKDIEIVTDVGLTSEALGEGWAGVRARVRDAVIAGDLDGFAQAVAAIGPALTASLPRAEDDVNELPDEVH